MGAFRVYNSYENDFIRSNFRNTDINYIAHVLGRTVYSIKSHASRMGLKKTKDFVNGTRRTRRVSRSDFMVLKFEYDKRPQGWERWKQGYIEIRIAPGVFVLKHIFLYQRWHGKIPKGCNIVFKDGNRNNFDPMNLIAVSKSCNLDSDLPPELKEAVTALKAIKRNLNEKQNRGS